MYRFVADHIHTTKCFRNSRARPNGDTSLLFLFIFTTGDPSVLRFIQIECLTRALGHFVKTFSLHVICRTWSGVMLRDGTDARIKVPLLT